MPNSDKCQKILILDKNPTTAIKLQLLLQKYGYSTLVASSYNEAIDYVKKDNPVLAFCDIYLGELLSGIDFAKNVYFISPHLKIIYLSEISNLRILKEIENTHPLNYIIKPWSVEQIKVTVKRAFLIINKPTTDHQSLECLSSSELKIIHLISKQKDSKEIADILCICKKTVRNHRYNIIKKLKLTNENNSLLKWVMSNIKSDNS